MPDPLSSAAVYEALIYSLPEQYPSIRRSTLVYIATGAIFGQVQGMLIFDNDIILCIQEYLNFELGVIEGYGYEVSRMHQFSDSLNFPPATEYCRASYPLKEKLYWYDSFPHPNDPSLASTHPHHKHIPPDIKHHRIPAPNLSFTRPNFSFLIEEVETQVLPRMQV